MDAKASAQTDDSFFVGECGYCGKWRHKKSQCIKQKEDQGPLAATAQGVETVSQIQAGEYRALWVFVVSASGGRNAKLLVGSGADEHVCPKGLRIRYSSETNRGMGSSDKRESRQGRQSGSGWSGMLDFVSRDTHEERVTSHSSGQRMTELTRRKSFHLQKTSCSKSWHHNIVDCRRERDSMRETLRGAKGSGWANQRQIPTTSFDKERRGESENNPNVGPDETCRNIMVVRDTKRTWDLESNAPRRGETPETPDTLCQPHHLFKKI